MSIYVQIEIQIGMYPNRYVIISAVEIYFYYLIYTLT